MPEDTPSAVKAVIAGSSSIEVCGLVVRKPKMSDILAFTLLGLPIGRKAEWSLVDTAKAIFVLSAPEERAYDRAEKFNSDEFGKFFAQFEIDQFGKLAEAFAELMARASNAAGAAGGDDGNPTVATGG